MAKTEVKMKEDNLKFQAAVRSNEATRILVTRASLVPYVSTTWRGVQQRSAAEIQLIRNLAGREDAFFLHACIYMY